MSSPSAVLSVAGDAILTGGPTRFESGLLVVGGDLEVSHPASTAGPRWRGSGCSPGSWRIATGPRPASGPGVHAEHGQRAGQVAHGGPRVDVAVERDALIADHACAPVGWHRIHAARIHAPLGAGHEESASLMQSVQSGEVQITPVHQVERTGFHGQHVQHTDLVGLAVADMDEGRNAAPQIQQGMQLDGRLGGAKRRLGKQRRSMVGASSA